MRSIIKREWMRLGKQPKVIVTTFLMPCALIILFMWLFLSGVLEKDSQSMAVVTASPLVKKFIDQNKLNQNVLIYKQMNEELASMYDKGQVGVIVEIEIDNKTAKLQYDSTKLSSNDVLINAQEFINNLALFLQDEEVYNEFLANPLAVLEKDMSSVLRKEEKQFQLLVSIFVAVLIFLVGQPLASFAIDSYVGEKERGTYDSIRLSGVEIFQFILGKTIFTVSIGIISGALQLTTALACLWYFKGSFGVETYVDNVPMLTLTVVLTICISLAMLVAILIYLSTYFEKVRDAGTYATIGTLIFTLLTQVSNVADHVALDYLPLFNINQMILNNAHGSATVFPLLVSVLLGCIIVAILTQMSVLKLRSKE